MFSIMLTIYLTLGFAFATMVLCTIANGLRGTEFHSWRNFAGFVLWYLTMIAIWPVMLLALVKSNG